MNFFTPIVNCKKYLFTTLFFLLCFLISIKNIAQININTLPASYSNNFNGYNPNQATNVPSTINSTGTGSGITNTLAGWVASTYNSNDVFNGRGTGIGSTGAMGGYWAYGSGSDFSLGALRAGTSSGAKDVTYTVSFTNNTTSTITNITLTWDYEQWRYANISGWDCSGTGSLASNNLLNAQDFAGISTGTNGTSTVNSVSVNLCVYVTPGSSFGISWLTTDKAGADNGVSIDNFAIAASTNNSTGPYTWNSTSGSGDYQLPCSWSPPRYTLSNSDVLNFSNGGTAVVTNVPDQTIGQLLISGNTKVYLEDVANDSKASILSLSGGAGTDFSVGAGSTLNFDVASSDDATDAMILKLASGVTGLVGGNINFIDTNSIASRPHRLLVSDAGSVVIQSPGYIKARSLDGNAFGGSNAPAGFKGINFGLVFSSGTVYEARDGANPFGDDANHNDARVVFQTGSLYKLNQNVAPALAGRTYADFELAYNGSITSFNGNRFLTYMDNLIIDAGSTLSFNYSGPNPPLPYTLFLKGNLTVKGTFIFDPVPVAASTLSLAGSSQQQITKTGSLTFGSNLTINLDNAAGLLLKNDLTISGPLQLTNGPLSINGKTLTLNGLINTINGTLNGSQASHLITGGTGGTVKFTQSAFNNYLKELTVNSGTLTIGLAAAKDILNITGSDGVSAGTYGIVTVNSGAILRSNSNLTLLSDALGTAQVAASLGIIPDTVAVQRYFSAFRAWRFIAVPFKNTNQTINAAWQEGNVYCDYSSCGGVYNGTAGYGTEITFNNDCSSTGGFDFHNNNYKTSIQTYQNNGWKTPATTYSNLVSEPSSLNPTKPGFAAYSLFVRGDRRICLSGINGSNTTTLRARGVLNQNGAPVKNALADGNAGDFILIGNPYACTISLNNLLNSSQLSSNINPNKFYTYNPAGGGSTGTGGYETHSRNGVTVPYYSGIANEYIQSGQAFMVQLSAAGTPSIEFRETDKVPNQSQTISGVFGLTAANSSQTSSVVYTNLEDETGAVMDGVAGVFSNQYSAAVDSVDATKRWNEEIENMALIRHDTALAIEFRPMPKASDTLFFRLYLRQHPYRLKVFSQTLAPDFSSKAWIVDKYLNTATEINLKDTSIYNFTPNSDTNSYRNRFMLVFSPINGGGRIAKLDSLINKVRSRIYPNPVSGKTFKLVLENAREGNYAVNIYTISGTLAATKNISYNSGNNTYNIAIPNNLTTGIYTVQVLNSAGTIITSMPLVVNR